MRAALACCESAARRLTPSRVQCAVAPHGRPHHHPWTRALFPQLTVGTFRNTLVAKWTGPAVVEAEDFVHLVHALSRAAHGVRVVLCVQGKSLRMRGARAVRHRSLLAPTTVVSCDRVDVDSLTLLGGSSTLAVCCLATTCHVSQMARADAVEVSRARLVDGVALPSSAKMLGGLGPRASQQPALAETARQAPELLGLPRRALIFSLTRRSECATTVHVTWDHGRAALIELDDPRTLNALTENALRGLSETLSLALAS